VPKPAEFRDITQRFRRFGKPREVFRDSLRKNMYEAALIQTSMTYWYLGVKEVIEDLRDIQPNTKIVLGGIYATLCAPHARGLGADLVVVGRQMQPLFQMLGIGETGGIPYWETGPRQVGVIKLTEGCPFHCTYCSVPVIDPGFRLRALDECLEELKQLVALGAQDIAFYDDALLYRANDGLVPFLESTIREGLRVRFHTPNALNARFVSAGTARWMVDAGFCSFYLGLESIAHKWQRGTGGKVYEHEFVSAVRNLRGAGAEFIAAYIILGHPESEIQEVEASMRFAHQQGVRIVLADFAPIPGTPDGERCRSWANLDEPLSHNKTAFTIRRLGLRRVVELKDLCRKLNAEITG
jgi:radical SAM superfamily enzyme YgiQ (UPF0313 family)